MLDKVVMCFVFGACVVRLNAISTPSTVLSMVESQNAVVGAWLASAARAVNVAQVCVCGHGLPMVGGSLAVLAVVNGP